MKSFQILGIVGMWVLGLTCGVFAQKPTPAPVNTSGVHPGQTSPSTIPTLKPAQNYSWGLIVAQEDEAVGRMVEEAQKCGGYLYQRQAGSIELRLPNRQAEACLAKISQEGAVIYKSMDLEDLNQNFQENLTKLSAKTRLLQDYFSLLDSSDAESYISISQSLQKLIFEIEELKSTQADLLQKSQWAEIKFSLSLPRREKRVMAEPSPFVWIRRMSPGRLLGEF